MDLSALNRIVQAPQAAASTALTAPVDGPAQARDVVRAVKALNGSEMFGQDNELMFQRDRQTQRMVLRIVNRQTHEVVSQIPPEYVLRLARGITGRT